MKNVIFLFTFLICSIGFSQNNAFGADEKLTFTVSYNMSGLLTDLAQVTMETSNIKTSTATLLRLKCTATTYSKWDNFFKIRDFYESYVSPTSIKPYLYKRDIYEGGYTKVVQYKYNRSAGTVKSVITKKAKAGGTYDKKHTLKVSGNTKDIVSTIYYLRTLDIHKSTPGDSDAFTILFDNKETVVSFTYLGKETISTNIGSKACYKLAIISRIAMC